MNKTKVSIGIVLGISIILFLSSLALANTPATAGILPLNGAVSGSVSSTSTDDWWKVVTTQDGKLTATITGTAATNGYLDIYDASGVNYFTYVYVSGAAAKSVSWDVRPGTYYIRVERSSGDWSYTLSNILTPAPLSDDTEGNGAYSTASTLGVNVPTTGHIGYSYNTSTTDTDDWWKIVTTQDGKLNVTLAGTEATNGYLDLYDASGINYFTYVYVSGTTPKSVSWDLRPGTYYIRVERSSGAWSYTLSNTLTPAQLSDDPEVNGAYTTASVLSVDVPATGHIGYSYNTSTTDTDDWWKVVTTQDGTLNVTLTGTAATNGYLDLYDASGVNYFTYVYASGATPKSLSWNLRPGTYYIRVERSSNAWSYTLSNTLTPATLSDDPEGNGAYTTASALSLNGAATGHVGYSYNTSTTDTDDWWKITTTQDGTLSVTLTGTETTNGYLDLYDTSGINYYTYVYVSGTTPKSLSWSLTPGTYYIRVERSSNAWSYTLSNTLTTTAAGTATPTPTPTVIVTRTPTPTPTPTPAPVAAGVIVSDSFDRVDADRCSLGQADMALGGSGTHFYLPIFPNGGTDPSNPIGTNIVSNTLANNGLDFGGVQFTSSSGACSNLAIRGENLGQDLNIKVDLSVPTDSAGHVTQAGPYLRSRAAASGDGIIGGTSSGYWIQLHSTGEVKVKKLNPITIVAFSGTPASFDSTVFHSLEIAAQGSSMQVALDGRLLTFNQGGSYVTTVSLPLSSGSNDGTAGVAFGAEPNRGVIGGQKADNLKVSSFSSLSSLPVQNNFVTVTPTVTSTPTGIYRLSATPTTVSPGESITVTFTAPGYLTDWISIYSINADNMAYGEWSYLDGRTSGTMSFTAPSIPGEYEFRLFQNYPDGGYNDIGRSNRIIVAAGTPTPTVTGTIPITENLNVSNSYIDIVVAPSGVYTMGTTGGNPLIRTDDNQRLLFGYPSSFTSYLTVRIDGIDYYTRGDSMDMYKVSGPMVSGNSIITSWRIGDIGVTQTISITTSSTTGREDTALFKVSLTNNGNVAHRAGARFMFDTMLGFNDAAPFRVPGLGDVTTERDFNGSDIPAYWQAFDSLTDPSVISQGTLAVSTPPNRFIMANWGNLYNAQWDYSVHLGSENGDSATAVYWQPVSIQPGRTAEYATAYGLGGVTVSQGLISLGISSPTSAESGDAFTVTAYIQNTGTTALNNVNALIVVPSGLALVPGETSGKSIGILASGAQTQVSWNLQAPGTGTSNFSVSVSASNAPATSASRTINVVPVRNSTASMIRSVSPSVIQPGSTLNVTLTPSPATSFDSPGYQVIEIIPQGFTFVGTEAGVLHTGSIYTFTQIGSAAITYTLSAPSTQGSYTISGTFKDSLKNTGAVSGSTGINVGTVTGGDLLSRYDANHNGRIDRSEAITAVTDYFGSILTRTDAISVVTMYFTG